MNLQTLQTTYVNLFREQYGVLPYSSTRNLTCKDKVLPAWDNEFALANAIRELETIKEIV